MADVDADAIYEARYDVTSAAHHLRMPRSTLSAWTQGQDGFRRVLDLPQPGFLSFVNLTEAFVLLAMRRRYSITLPRIRQAVSYVEAEMGSAPTSFSTILEAQRAAAGAYCSATV